MSRAVISPCDFPILIVPGMYAESIAHCGKPRPDRAALEQGWERPCRMPSTSGGGPPEATFSQSNSVHFCKPNRVFHGTGSDNRLPEIRAIHEHDRVRVASGVTCLAT